MKNLLHNIYENVKACVRNNNELSDTFNLELGVRQGCILSPFLFSFFINELATQIEMNCENGIQLHPDIVHVFLLLFADDIVLFSSTLAGLQKLIMELETYCDEYKLKANRNKTKVVVFKRGGRLAKNEKWQYRGIELETTNSYKYLGIFFSHCLSWLTHAKYASLQAQKVMIGLHKQLNVFGDLNISSYFKIFDAKIYPIISYGAEIWGLSHLPDIERVQLQACKKFLGVKHNTTNLMVYGECGRYPMSLFTSIKVIKYWLKLLNMPPYRLPKKCYNMLVLFDRNGHTNWVTAIRKFLFSKGFGYVWNNQYVDFKNLFISELTRRLKDMYLHEWFENMSLSSKCLYYRMIKYNLDQEMYLSVINVKKFRTALSRFRCSSHNLYIESGRFRAIDRENRICKLCDQCAIEDEYHFLLICPVYTRLRNLYINKYYNVHANQHKFVALLSNRNKIILQNLAMCVYYAMKFRAEYMLEHNISYM
ncbi:uncharacterized protein [Haliotis asinina]|uniref:uncharacterized protein n=1 Tax=Haliotis asinina TaxID=109174 RepID=UPI003531894D